MVKVVSTGHIAGGKGGQHYTLQVVKVVNTTNITSGKDMFWDLAHDALRCP